VPARFTYAGSLVKMPITLYFTAFYMAGTSKPSRNAKPSGFMLNWLKIKKDGVFTSGVFFQIAA